MRLNIEYLPIDSIEPYSRNTRKHNKKQIANLMQSIQSMGFNDPIAVWGPDNTVVEGHGRLEAARRLGMETIPAFRLDHLTDQQRREYAILHNKLAEQSTDDKAMLKLELPDLDFSGFDIGIDFMQGDEYEEKHEENQNALQSRVESILNLGKGQFYSENPYDFPEIAPVTELPPIREWIRFKDVLSDDDPEGKAVHFFIDDYQFERVWANPEKYVDKLRRYVCVATPDFSPYGDMPLIAQMWNHYRKHWVGAWLQEHGVTVIPTIRCSTDPRSLEWYLDGEPHNGIVIMSSMWTHEAETEMALEEYKRMKETLNPCKIFIYGGTGHMGIKPEDPVEYIETFRPKGGKDA